MCTSSPIEVIGTIKSHWALKPSCLELPEENWSFSTSVQWGKMYLVLNWQWFGTPKIKEIMK